MTFGFAIEITNTAATRKQLKTANLCFRGTDSNLLKSIFDTTVVSKETPGRKIWHKSAITMSLRIFDRIISCTVACRRINNSTHQYSDCCSYGLFIGHTLGWISLDNTPSLSPMVTINRQPPLPIPDELGKIKDETLWGCTNIIRCSYCKLLLILREIDTS